LAALANHVDMDYASRMTLDKLTREIRQATALKALEPNKLSLIDYDGQAVVYEYVPEARLLTRTKGATTQVLLSDCDGLTFTVYKSSPIAGTFDQTPVTDVTSRKVVSVQWTSSRKVISTRQASESGQSAKVVIRKH